MIAAPANPWKLGLFVLLAGVLGLMGLVYFASARFDRRTFDAVTLIDESVQGLDEGSPVKFRGVTIGKVRSIGFAADRRHVEVQLEVYLDTIEALGLEDKRFPDPNSLSFVAEGVRLRLSRSGITGITFLEADIYPPDQYPVPEYEFRVPMALIPSIPSRLKGLEDGVEVVVATFPQLLMNLNDVTQRVRGALEAVDVGATVRRVDRVFDQASERLEAVDPGTLGRVGGDLSATLAELRKLSVALSAPDGALLGALDATRGAMGTFDRTLVEIEAAATAEALRSAGLSLARLGDSGARAGESVSRELSNLNDLLHSLRALADLLERDPGVLLRGRLEEAR